MADNLVGRVLEVEQEFTDKNGGNVTVLRVIPKKIYENSLIDAFKQELETLYPPTGDYCIDFSNVEGFGSRVPGVLLGFDRKLRESKQSPLTIAGCKPGTYEVFFIMKLDRFFDMQNSVEAYTSKRRAAA